MNFRPTQDRVYFERMAPAPVACGIVTTTKPRFTQDCRIISVGPRVQHVKPGDHALIDLNVGQPVEGLAGRICREPEIMAVLRR